MVESRLIRFVACTGYKNRKLSTRPYSAFVSGNLVR